MRYNDYFIMSIGKTAVGRMFPAAAFFVVKAFLMLSSGIRVEAMSLFAS